MNPLDPLQVGEKVTWTHTSSNGTNLRFQTREGKVIEIDGFIVQVQMRNGRRFRMHKTSLTKFGDTTELTKLFTEMAEQISDNTSTN